MAIGLLPLIHHQIFSEGQHTPKFGGGGGGGEEGKKKRGGRGGGGGAY